MLRKIADFNIDEQKPFANDKLQRVVIADNLTNLLKTLNQPFVLSISASWGKGKTTFVKMWQAHLKNEGFTCLYFNAWENDFADDPFISFIGEIEEHLNQGLIDTRDKEKLSKSIQSIKKIGGSLIRNVTPLAIKLATYGLLSNVEEVKNLFDPKSGSTIADFMSKVAEDRINEYVEKKKSIKDFKKRLEEFVSQLSQEGNSYPVVFFIDELDRCRPHYAIQLLESIKHLFCVNGIVFILAIAKDQIIKSIKSMYGLEMEADGYLRRFIDLDYELPDCTKKTYHRYIFEKFDIERQFVERGKPENADFMLPGRAGGYPLKQKLPAPPQIRT